MYLGKVEYSSSYLFISPRAGLHFLRVFLRDDKSNLYIFYSTTIKLVNWETDFHEVRKMSDPVMTRTEWPTSGGRLITSGSMAAPSRDAVALLCSLHDHVQPGSHVLWLHLFPGADRVLLGGSKTGVSADCWLS
jgi:hypothetical protein